LDINIKNKISEKRKNTNKKLYGVEYYCQTEEYKIKVRSTHMKNYGVNHIFQSKEIKNKTKNTNFEKFGSIYSTQRHYTLEQLEIVNNPERLKEIYNEHVDNEIPVEQLSLKYRFSESLLGQHFKKNGLISKKFSKSFQENIIKEFLDELNIDHIQNDRQQLNGKELDFYIPEYQLGIEINGLYWHNENKKDKYNLLIKYNLCKEKGIKLLHFWDIEVKYKFEIAKSIIKDNLGLNQIININNYIIKEISQEESYEFYENNHILGGISCDYNYGLYYEEELLSCIGINKVEEGYKIIRDCTKIGYNIAEGFSKLLNYVKNMYNKFPIYLVLDKRLFNEEKYMKFGVKLYKDTLPNIYYHKSRILYTYEDFIKLYNNLQSNMIKLKNWNRIYDCGNLILKIN